MHRGGLQIERSRMFEMQASDKVTTYNAYVTGIGASKRVVVWDNTSRDLTIPETLFVFGHEQGHYVLHHVWMQLGFLSSGLLLSLYLAHRFAAGVLARWGQRWGVRDLGDWASLPVHLLLLNVFSLVGQPVGAAFSRHLEHQADIYGLEVIHGLVPDSPQVAAHAFQKLGEKACRIPSESAVRVLGLRSSADRRPHRVRCALTSRGTRASRSSSADVSSHRTLALLSPSAAVRDARRRGRGEEALDLGLGGEGVGSAELDQCGQNAASKSR